MEHRLLAAHRADRGQLVDPLRQRHQGGERLERPAVEGDVEPGDDDDDAAIGEPADHRDDRGPEELRLVDRDHVGPVRDRRLDLVGARRGQRREVGARVRGEAIGAVPRVERVAEHDDPAARDRRAPDAPQQLLGLAREHRPADHLDPTRLAHARRIASRPIRGRELACPTATDR